MIIGYGITTALSVLFFVLYRILVKKREFWLSLLFACIALVNVGYLMLSLAKSVEFAIFANDVAYLGSVFLSTCMLFTIIKLCGYKVTKAHVIIALSLGVVMFLIVATSGILPWYYKSVSIESIIGATVLKKDYGILHPVYLVYLVLYFLAMLTTIIHSIAKKRAAAQKFSVVMLGIVLINLFIWFIEKFGKWEFEFLSVSYIFSEILFVLLYWTMQDYIRKEDVSPPAKTVINSVSVSAIDLPEIGEFFVYPDETTLTYGGEYLVVGCWMEMYTGTEWEYYTESTDIVTHSVKYRYVLTLRPNAGYTFPEDIIDEDVTINGSEGVVLMVFPDDAFTNEIEVALEFSYPAPVLDYGITIADKDGSATVGVDITTENYEDVLGDGTVSYNPTTNTLTLNNYVYNGEGALVDEGGYMAIMADIPTEGLTIVLVGTNSITVSGSDSAGMVFFGEGNLTIKGNGSLSTNTIMYGITVQTDSGKLTIENAKLNITTTNAMAIGIQATDFVMTSGDLKITASMIGVGASKEAGICINGGSVEIGTATGGYSFIYLDFEHMSFNPIAPDLSGYVGDYNMVAGIDATGSDAGEFNEGYLSSYKYIKIASVNDTPAEDNNGLGTGAIVGIVLGSVAVVGVGGFAIVWFVIKKKSWAEFLAIFKKK